MLMHNIKSNMGGLTHAYKDIDIPGKLLPIHVARHSTWRTWKIKWVSDSESFSTSRDHCRYSNLIQNSQAVKKVCGPQKGYGEKRCEIQGGGQEMAVMVG